MKSLLTLLTSISSIFLLALSVGAEVSLSKAYLFPTPESEQAGARGVALFNLAGRSRCMFGDLDALLLDIERSDDSAALQLSLEPLPHGSGPVLYGTPHAKEETPGSLGTFQVAFPKELPPTLYAVHLCSVAQDTDVPTPCSSQQLLEINQMLRPYRIDKSRAFDASGKAKAAPLPHYNTATANYKNYYFSFVVVDRETIYFLSNELNEEDYNALPQKLRELATLSGEPLQKAIADIRKYSQTLGSYALKAERNALQMYLPFYDKKRCLGQ